MKRLKNYKDEEKKRAYIQRTKRKYYGRTAYNRNYRNPWCMKDIQMVIKHEIPDNEIADKIGRSVSSIQTFRSRYKKENGVE